MDIEKSQALKILLPSPKGTLRYTCECEEVYMILLYNLMSCLNY